MVMEIQVHRCSEPSCSFFNQVLPHNAKVCPMCGTSLGQALESSMKQRAVTNYSQPVVESSLPPSRPNIQARPQLTFRHHSGQRFILLRDSGIIGRQSLTNGARPEIDLTLLPHAGVISRSHAHVYWDANQQNYMIIDDSRNGSYLNGVLLARGAPHPLNIRDQLHLGQDKLICLEVEFGNS